MSRRVDLLTAETITTHLIRHRWADGFVLPHYTPGGWWECDVFELTKAGLFVEYEVKVSRSDFRADRHKCRLEYEWVGGEPACEHTWTREGNGWRCGKCPAKRQKRRDGEKHKRLANADPGGPSRFWYVVPAGLVTIAELPPFAGLIECRIDEKWHDLVSNETRKAPRLHLTKIDDRVKNHALGVCYYRMHRALKHQRDNAATEYVI